MKNYLIAIDPGREKTGLAVMNFKAEVVYHKIVPSNEFIAILKELMKQYIIEILVIGSGTSSKQKQQLLKEAFPNMSLAVVDEYKTTEKARKLYFKENPPKGLRRLIPLGMQIPPVPIDDYAAIMIGKNYLK